VLAPTTPEPEDDEVYVNRCAIAKKICLYAAALALAGCAVNDYSTAAWVCGEPVSLGEYRHELVKNYSRVLSKTVSAGGIQGKGFWETGITFADSADSMGVITPGVITPLEMLKAAALQSSTRRKVVQIWARERGLADDISYKAFVKNFRDENIRRKEALSRGEPVYGPEQYTQAIYYDLTLAETEHSLKKTLEAGFAVDEGELLRLYEADYRAGTYHPGRTTIDCAFINIDAGGRVAEALRAAVTGGEEMGGAAGSFGAGYRRQSINLLRMPGMGLSAPMQEAARSLEAGGVSRVVEDGEYYWVFKCIEREGEKYLSFDETKPAIMQDLLEKEYKKQLEARMAGACKVNPRVYAKIDEKFVTQG
jgi:hypothetical protein